VSTQQKSIKTNTITTSPATPDSAKTTESYLSDGESNPGLLRVVRR
jgi:hypothetical protein